MRFAGVLLIALALNLLLLKLPIDLSGLGSYGYLGVAVIVFINNATVLFPVPIAPAAVAKTAAALNVWGVIVASAMGSILGESVGFIIGRAGKGVIERSRVYDWFQRQLEHPIRAAVAIFILAAIPNPTFDVVGITAGAMGLRYPLFVIPAFLGNLVKMFLFALAGRQLIT